VVFDDLATPAAVQKSQTASARLLPAWCCELPRRVRNSHKGQFGHVLLLGGELGYSGAIRLAAEAAARIGAGLVSVATRPQHAGLINLTRPELMSHGIADPAELKPLLARAGVVAIGPGLGLSPWSQALLDAALASSLPLVVDADALNLLAQSPVRRDDWVLTPHPGEAARLLGWDSRRIQLDRFTAVKELQRTYGGIVVLKGCGSLVQGPDGPPQVCRQGNPGMATGGMGDVLTGVIAALLAQGAPIAEAARAGVALHAAAGDLAASQAGERGLLAGDLMPALRRLVNP
jgi:NAD(P)H-hydrate epimerase